MSTMDKIKAKVDNMLHKDTTNDPTGPHDTHAANKADPRVDSDHYGTTGNTQGAGGVGGGQYTGNTSGSGMTGSTGTGMTGHTGTGQYGSSTGTGMTGSSTTGNYGTTGSDPTGPHDSRLGNKMDPRVDSDRVGAQGNTQGAGGMGGGQYTEGTTGHHGHHGHHGHQGTGGAGLSGSLGSTGYGDATGPHNTHTANVLDPRVDSDRVGTAGNTQSAGGMGGGQYTEGTTGHHGHGHHHQQQHGVTGTQGGYGGNNVGTGNAPGTAGPHKSDMLNKMDPRVDSDLDGSKTVGGNATYQ